MRGAQKQTGSVFQAPKRERPFKQSIQTPSRLRPGEQTLLRDWRTVPDMNHSHSYAWGYCLKMTEMIMKDYSRLTFTATDSPYTPLPASHCLSPTAHAPLPTPHCPHPIAHARGLVILRIPSFSSFGSPSWMGTELGLCPKAFLGSWVLGLSLVG